MRTTEQEINNILDLVGNDNHELKLWVVKAIIGSIVADHVIDPNEEPLVKIFIKLMPDDLSIHQEIFSILKDKEPPPLDKIEVSSELASGIIRCLLIICTVDEEFHYLEIRFVKEAAEALGIDPLEIHRMIDLQVLKLKSESFDDIQKGMTPKEKYWLASVIMKTVFSDKHVDSQELLYFGDVYDLIDHPDEFFKTMESKPNQITLEGLPDVDFSYERSTQIIKYILSITMIDRDFSDREHLFLRKLAQLLNFDGEELTKLIRSTKKSLGMLDQSTY